MIIAKPKTSASEAALAAVFRAYGLEPRPAQTELDPNIYLTGPGVLTDPLAVCETLNKTGLFEYTQPNCLRFVATAGTPNDPLYAANWGLAKMNLPAAWDMTTGCASIKIAIIDDGVQLNHPDLVGNLLPGFDATNSGTNGGHVAGEEMHGTFCAGSSAVWSASAGLSMNGNLATRQNGYSGAGTITATLTVPNACAAIPVKRTIWVGKPNLTKTVDGVVLGTTSVTAGGSYNLAASSSSPGTTFNYSNYAGSGNMTIDLYTPNNPTTQMYIYSNSTDGFRQVKLTGTNACGNYAEDFVFLLQSGNFKAYPNPAKDKITLEFENPATLAVMPARVELYHEKSAKPIHLVVIRDVNDVQGLRERNKLDLDVSGLPRGTYYLHVWRPDQSKEVVGKLKFILE